MKTSEYEGGGLGERSHPWVDAAGNPECRYYDLTVAPEHIRTSLEDFRPWGHYAGVEDFYTLLERLNHPRSVLESNDCAFSGPHATEAPGAGRPFECSGRLMVLFRALERNTTSDVAQLKARLHAELGALDPKFRWGVIGTAMVPVRYLALSARGGPELGNELMICFWAWGESETETMLNFARLVKNLAQAMRRSCAALS